MAGLSDLIRVIIEWEASADTESNAADATLALVHVVQIGLYAQLRLNNPPSSVPLRQAPLRSPTTVLGVLHSPYASARQATRAHGITLITTSSGLNDG